MPKVLISTPVYNYQTHARMVGSLIGCLRNSPNIAIGWNYTVSSALAWARNLAVDMAIKENFDWLFYWDSDVSIDELDFLPKLIALADEKQAVAVGIPYAMKGFPIEYAVRSNDTRYGAQGTPDTIPLPTEPFEATQLGTGTLLIRVSALKKIEPPWFTFIDKYENGEPTFWPEDYNFCDRLGKEGKIYADPRFKTMHWGQFAYFDQQARFV